MPAGRNANPPAILLKKHRRRRNPLNGCLRLRDGLNFYPKMPQPNAIVQTTANTTTMISHMSSFFIKTSLF